MAKRRHVYNVSDLSEAPIDGGLGKTVRFGLRRSTFEVDLTNEEAEEFEQLLERYIKAGRRVS